MSQTLLGIYVPDSLFYLLRPKPIAFSIFLTVLNETLCALSLPWSKMSSSLSEL